ncbi:MAG TPA: hypothetical protein VF939_06995 [Puia sp.]
MSITINDYRCKLINKILFSTSQEEVKRYIDTAMKGLLQHKVNGHLVTRFVERTAKDLAEFNPMDRDAQQWANIKMARIQFNQIKRSLHTADQH